MTCLQRLAISKGLPKSRLKDVLEALSACTSLGLDIQLRVLQALPALAQNYSEDLKGPLLAGTLQICAALQGVKVATVSGVAAATLQQLVVSVYDKVSSEDARLLEIPVAAEVPGEEGPISLRESAFDAYRVFQDICLATEGRKTSFVQLSMLSQAAGMELIWACMNTHPKVFATHPEQRETVRSLIMPLLIRILSERQSFPITLRAMRIISVVLRQHLPAMSEECEIVLGLLTHMLDQEAAAPWKRAMCMEVFRSIYAEPGLPLQMYMRYDEQDGKKAIIRDNVATFVRLSTERPALIGLGQQSSIPTGPSSQRDSLANQAAAEAAGDVAGVIGTAIGVGEISVPGISSKWSIPKSQCLDQLDKAEPPALPDTYIYYLVLECLNSLSEGLAKVVLPLTVQHDRQRARQQQEDGGNDLDEAASSNTAPGTIRTRVKRSQSYRSRAVPLNPLSDEQGPSVARVRAIADLMEECWPALLATCSTFLYAALDNDYYRSLIRSFQRFAQVSGLLRLFTARDAFLTTLGKAAVPPHMLTSSISGGHTDSPRLFQHSQGMLSVDSLASQPSVFDKSRRPSSSHEPAKQRLTTRNLLCLRALLNIAIALGPTLENSFAIVLETLQQADVVVNAANGQAYRHDSRSGAPSPSVSSGDPFSNSLGLSSEITAVEAAALRLFESSADYPNDAFLHMLRTLCGMLDGRPDDVTSPATEKPPPTSPRRMSSLPGINTEIPRHSTSYVFVLSKLGELADLNVARFASDSPNESGWRILVEQLIQVSVSSVMPKDARCLAADVLCRCSEAIAEFSTKEGSDEPESVQQMAFSSLQLQVHRLYAESDELTSVDIEIHGKTLEALRSVLERCGEALTAGWDTILAMIGSVFHDKEETENVQQAEGDEVWLHLSSQIIAPSLGRTAFGAMQLVCSDFLASLPEASLSPLIELLYHFATQDEDFNVSLTTITLFLDVSDFLVARGSVSGLTGIADGFVQKGMLGLTHKTIVTESKRSRSMQWILLLYRLTDVVSDNRAEVRNGAFQTLMRIFKNCEDQLSASPWQLCLETLILRLLRRDAENQKNARSTSESTSAETLAGLEYTTKTVVEGTASLIADNLQAVGASKNYPHFWSSYIHLFADYLNDRSAMINAAVYSALSQVLRVVPVADDKWASLVQDCAGLWTSSNPSNETSTDAEQDAYLAYLETAVELYRLTERTITAEQLVAMARNLAQCIRYSSGGSYVDDTNNLTPLQIRVLDVLKAVRRDIATVPSALVKIAAELVALPFQNQRDSTPRKSLSFVALSKASMDWLRDLLTTHLASKEVFATGAVEAALENLAIPIELKYRWRRQGKTPSLWRKATSTALAVIEPILQQMRAQSLKRDVRNRIWTDVVRIAQAIISADCSDIDTALPATSIVDDEDADCDSLGQLRNMIIPELGSSSIPDRVRSDYASSLFHTSIIHAGSRGEIPQAGQWTRADVHKIRPGRVWDPDPVLREKMAYLCFSELIILVAVSDGSEERVKLAQAAAPYLILRLALPIKAYIADQPLRGSMPQPLSQVQELLFCLREIRRLESEPKAMEKGANRAHIDLLYPIFVKAVGVAGHRRHGNREVLEALQDVLEIAGVIE